VFGAVESGKAALNVREASGGHVHDYKIPEVDEIFDPSFSPDGRQVVFSAQTGGVTDLFVYDLEASRLRRLTHDAYADLQPSWAPDGRSIVFSTDRFSTNLETLGAGNYRLGLINPDGFRYPSAPQLRGREEHQPQMVAGRGQRLLHLRPHGISNVYRLDVASGQTRKSRTSSPAPAGSPRSARPFPSEAIVSCTASTRRARTGSTRSRERAWRARP